MSLINVHIRLTLAISALKADAEENIDRIYKVVGGGKCLIVRITASKVCDDCGA